MAENWQRIDRPGELISFVRWLRGWTQAELGKQAGIAKSQITRYETGKEIPRPATLERIFSAAGVPLRQVEFLQRCLRLIRKTLELGQPAEGVLEVGLVELGGDTRTAVWKAVEEAMALARAELELLARPAPVAGPPNPPTQEDHLRVEALFERLSAHSEEEQRLLVEGSTAFRDWLLCLRLCRASEQAAAAEAREALKLAELALLVSRHVSGPAAWRSRLQGYCTGFLANAERVAGELPRAEATFMRAWRLWRPGAAPAGLLSGACLLDLEASLRRDQRLFPQALKLHEEALEMAGSEEVGFILLNKSATLEQKGDSKTSIDILEQAAQTIDVEQQPRLVWVLRFNQAANLCRLGQAVEAARIVPEVRELAERLQNDLDLVRTLWLEANIAAGLGRREEAVAALEQVRCAFEDRKIPYDYALASLDLALLYRGEGRFAEIRALAGEMLAIFRAQGVHREALGAVLLFQEAAARQQITAELVQRLQEYLQKARGNPQLRFKA